MRGELTSIIQRRFAICVNSVSSWKLGPTRRCPRMHFSAKRGLAIAVLRSHVVRPSVCLSVALVDCDHIGWKSWKLIAQTISPTPSLFAAKSRSTYSQGNMGNFGETTLWAIKNDTRLFFDNSGKYWPIFVIVSLIYSAGNWGIRTC